MTIAGVPRHHGRVRPLPRSQVRPDPAEGLLRAGGHLPQHRDVLRHGPLHQSQRPSAPCSLPKDCGLPAGSSEMLRSRRARRGSRSRSTTSRSKQRRPTDPIRRIFTSAQIAQIRSRLDCVRLGREPEAARDGCSRQARRRRSGRRPIRPGGFGQRTGFGGFGGFGGTPTIADSPVYNRGEPDKPGTTRVPRGTLQVMSKFVAEDPRAMRAAGSNSPTGSPRRKPADRARDGRTASGSTSSAAASCRPPTTSAPPGSRRASGIARPPRPHVHERRRLEREEAHQARGDEPRVPARFEVRQRQLRGRPG